MYNPEPKIRNFEPIERVTICSNFEVPIWYTHNEIISQKSFMLAYTSNGNGTAVNCFFSRTNVGENNPSLARSSLIFRANVIWYIYAKIFCIRD